MERSEEKRPLGRLRRRREDINVEAWTGLI